MTTTSLYHISMMMSTRYYKRVLLKITSLVQSYKNYWCWIIIDEESIKSLLVVKNNICILYHINIR